ncbi:MAG: riboflavin synthase [Haliscomenobacteraceae bacterium CHB4]|nr:Riboflavin synthase [Saprospiraceae bacterium]MCE7922651.1 riboflavin synthase [Haliscomenobacteraceae bacterium CHB4]
MFTGIIEALGAVKAIERDRSNVHFTIESPLSHELKIDQSVSHNGVCLTVVGLEPPQSAIRNPQSAISAISAHRVTAVEETLRRTNLSHWVIGSFINLERCLPIGGRLDGHIVQGHVDDTAECVQVAETGGSWRFTFRYRPTPEHLLVDKGSICINGVSLTVVEPRDDLFSVAIIPYTWEHTNFKTLREGDAVNIEFDILGKYISRYLALYK